MSEVVYLYGFVPKDAPAPPPDVRGVGDVPVRLIDLGAVHAAVADLPAAAYSSQVVEARLQDLVWVGEQGMAHERIVVWFADHAEILPARLFSLYSADAALRDAAADRLEEVTDALEALAGRREWNLKVGYDPVELARHGAEVSPGLRRIDDDIAAAPPGRRYLLERRRADTLKQEISIAARTLAGELLDELRAHADDALVLPQAAGDESTTIVLNAALLVSRAAEDELTRHAADLYQRYTALGMVVSFSGPWAPYRFVEVYHDA